MLRTDTYKNRQPEKGLPEGLFPCELSLNLKFCENVEKSKFKSWFQPPQKSKGHLGQVNNRGLKNCKSLGVLILWGYLAVLMEALGAGHIF